MWVCWFVQILGCSLISHGLLDKNYHPLFLSPYLSLSFSLTLSFPSFSLFLSPYLYLSFSLTLSFPIFLSHGPSPSFSLSLSCFLSLSFCLSLSFPIFLSHPILLSSSSHCFYLCLSHSTSLSLFSEPIYPYLSTSKITKSQTSVG